MDEVRRCYVCGVRLPDGYDKRRCMMCRDKQRGYLKKRYLRLSNEGKCPHCGKLVEDEGYITCRACRQRSRDGYWRKKGGEENRERAR